MIWQTIMHDQTGIPFSETFFALKYDFEFGLIFARVPH